MISILREDKSIENFQKAIQELEANVKSIICKTKLYNATTMKVSITDDR